MGNTSSKGLFIFTLSFMIGVETASAMWPPFHYGDIAVFPHLVGIADLIFTGTPVSTNGDVSAEFIVDEVLWGHVTGTNITVRDYSPYHNPAYQLGEKYLVGAFTNDWWINRYDFGPNNALLHFVPATNPPPTGIFFNDYLLLYRHHSVIPFSSIEYGGTNYWEGTRTLITNLLDVGRVRCDEGKVREIVESAINDAGNSRRLPLFVIRKMMLYKAFRYDWEDFLSQPHDPRIGQEIMTWP